MRGRTQPWLVTILALVTACVPTGDVTGTTEVPTDAPELPPVESLVVDLSFFTAAGGAAAEPAGASMVVRDHWENAAERVETASAPVTDALALPVKTWAAAAQATAIFEAGRWRWRFSATHGGLTYDGDLSGVAAGSQASFTMRLTQASLGLAGFTWYTGVTPVDGGSGFWQFFHPQSQGEIVGRVDWSSASDDARTVAFSAVGGAANNGDVLTYEVSGTERRMHFVEFSTGDVIDVSWDAVTGEGHVTADGYNSGAKSCWDGEQNDSPCAS